MCSYEKVFERTFETPFGKTVTLRRSCFSKKDWAYICSRFSVTEWPPERVISIKIEGQDSVDRFLITATVEKVKHDIDAEEMLEQLSMY